MQLSCGDLAATLSPMGARITVSHKGRDVMRDCFAMLPLGNRVEGNFFDLGGQRHHFQPNTQEPFYLHGDGWLELWQVLDITSTSARLAMDHPKPAASPHIYSAEMTVSLAPLTFTVGLRITNTGPAPMPFGLGLHPFFSRNDTTRLTAPANKFWTERAGFLPGASGPFPATANFHQAAPLPAHRLNNAYEGWLGHALIQTPELTLNITADPVFAHLMIYAPQGEDFFCLEPMTHLPNALAQRGAQALHILATGQALSGQITFTLKE